MIRWRLRRRERGAPNRQCVAVTIDGEFAPAMVPMLSPGPALLLVLARGECHQSSGKIAYKDHYDCQTIIDTLELDIRAAALAVDILIHTPVIPTSPSNSSFTTGPL